MAKLGIAAVRLTRITVPLTMVHAGSMYVIQKAERTVVELTLENGVVGLGDTWGTAEVWSLLESMARAWIGKDAGDRFALRVQSLGKSTYDNKTGRNGRAAFAGLDLAAWDAVGKSLGLSVAELIGARRRESVEMVSTLPAAILPRAVSRQELTAHLDDLANTPKVVDFALAQVRKFGFRNFKLKSAAHSPEWDWKLLNELKEAMPGVRLRFDPNANYGPVTATELCRRLDGLGLEFFEDPTGEAEGLARLRAAVKTPIATNMWCVADEQIAPCVRRGVTDVVLGDLAMWGGIDAVRRMARATQAFGLKPAIHSVYETGITTVANLHLASALGEVEYPNDCSLHFMSADVLAEPQAVVDGRMTLPKGPGLGVTLDRARLDAVATESVDLHP